LYNKDKNLIKYVSDPTSDMHGDMAKQIFMLGNEFKIDKHNKTHKIMRQAAKNSFVFPEFYGDYYVDCAEGICDWVDLPRSRWKPNTGQNIDGLGFISDHLISHGIKEFGKVDKSQRSWKVSGFLKHIQEIEEDFWQNRFPDYARWKDEFFQEYQNKGYFDLLTGFRCSGVMDKKQVSNAPAQGAAFHCLLFTLIELDKVIIHNNLDSRIIGQIHDSVIIDINTSELKFIAETAHKIATEILPALWKWIIVPFEIEMDLCEVDMPWNTKSNYEFK